MRGSAGFSLIELLIVSTVLSLLFGGVLTLLSSSQGSFEAQQARLELRQEARVAFDKLTRETRAAGYLLHNVGEAVASATNNTLQFAADIDDGDNDLPCGAGFENAANGGVERITYRLAGSELLRDLDCWDGATWNNETTGQLVAGNLVAEQTLFRYFDDAGTELVPGAGGLDADDRAAIRSIALSVRMIDTTSRQTVGEAYPTETLTTHVQLHNLSDEPG